MHNVCLFSGGFHGDSRGPELLDEGGVLCGGKCESVKTAHHHDYYAALPDCFAQAREFEAIACQRFLLASTALIMGHDVPILKAVGGAAVVLHLECEYLAQRF